MNPSDNLRQFVQETYSNVRSPHRTKKLHDAVLSAIDLPFYDWKFEHCFYPDSYGNKFDVDIAGFLNGHLKIAVLVKCNNSNIAKNLKNYANTTIGESARLMLSETPPEKILFVSIFPRKSPVFNKHGEVVRIENVVRAKTKTDVVPVLQKLWGERVETIDCFYDIVDIKMKTKKEDFFKINICKDDFELLESYSKKQIDK